MNVGLVGAGIIGRRRAQVVHEFDGTDLVMVADIDVRKAGLLAEEIGCEATSDWRKIVDREDVEVIMVATPTKFLAPISIDAMRRGKHVLCEKPMGMNPEEAKEMVEVGMTNNVKLKVGFNHRHFPHICKARELINQGAIGELIFIRCRYGHGGRPDYENEWRTDPEMSSGGELVDQGVHALDLFRWFMGDFSETIGFVTTKFWDIVPLEDNAFGLFRTPKGQIASLHASWTQWKNLFSFEIFGQEGYLIAEGRGGYYGSCRLIVGKKSSTFGPPKEEVFEFPGQDHSWYEEWKEFVASIKENREPLGSGYDGWQAIRMAYAVYKAARKGCVVRL